MPEIVGEQWRSPFFNRRIKPFFDEDLQTMVVVVDVDVDDATTFVLDKSLQIDRYCDLETFD